MASKKASVNQGEKGKKAAENSVATHLRENKIYIMSPGNHSKNNQKQKTNKQKTSSINLEGGRDLILELLQHII